MTTQFWVGVVFAAALTLFLFVAFYAARRMDAGQWVILRFLSSLCAACAAAFIIGEIAVSASGGLGAAGKWSVYATSGFGAFVLVWLTFPKPPEGPLPLPDDTIVSIPEGISFKEAVFLIATQDKASAKFHGFKDKELSTPLRGGSLQGKHVQILGALGARGATSISDYKVSFADAVYVLRVKS